MIFVTERRERDYRIAGLKLGAIDYITKPFSPAIVDARVKTQLKLSQTLNDVKAASAKIRNLLDNAGQGFLSFESDLTIEDEYSEECRNIFECEIKNMNFP